MERTKVIIFDIDGTVANIEHRRVFVASKPKNWYAFNNSMHLDTRYDDIFDLYKMFVDAGHTIIFASGRGEEQRKVTVNWLHDNDFIYYDQLYMRPAKDNRPDYEIKKEILDKMREDGYEPYMAIDDRDQVVKMWRENGIRCLQAAPGDF